MRTQLGDCSCCAARFFCKSLCRHAEQIADAGRVPQNPNEHLGGLLLEHPTPLPPVDSLTHLTPNEIKILRYLAAGLTRSEIAEVLNISLNSVYVHISNMKKKHEKS